MAIEEYRLVPVEEAEHFDDDEKVVDLVALARDLWDHRRFLAAVFSLFLMFGAIYYLFTERTWYSEIALMPETRSSSGMERILQQYQGILGVQLPGSEEGESLSVTLYPTIVESYPFQIELIQREVYVGDLDRTMTLFEYLTEVREKTILEEAGELLWSITLGLPRTVAGLFSSDEAQPMPAEIDFSQYSDLESPWILDPAVRQAVNDLENWITVRIEPQSEFIIIGASFPDARASAELVHIIKELLTRHVTEYRIVKATQDMEFIEEQYEQARTRFQQVQDSLATFHDRNVMLSSARSLVSQQRLQAEYDLTLDVYTSLATRLEEAKIKVQEETPIFRIHEPVMVPGRPSAPRLSRVAAGVIFFSLFVGVSMIYLRRGMIRFYNDFTSRT